MTVHIAKNQRTSSIFQTYVAHSVSHLDELWHDNSKIQNALTIKMKVAIELKTFKKGYV